MNIKSLCFIFDVYKSGSYSVAAEKLGYSYSGIAKRIKRIEDTENISFFIRSSKVSEMMLTEEGKILMPYIENIVLSYRDYQSKLNEICSLPSAPIIGIEKNRHGIINSINYYRENYCPISVLIGTKYDLINLLNNKVIDAFLARFIFDKESDTIIENDINLESFSSFPIGSGNPLGFLVPTDSPISNCEKITPYMGMDISNYTFLKERNVGNANTILYVLEHYFIDEQSSFNVSSKTKKSLLDFFNADDACNYIIPYYEGNDITLPKSLVYKPLSDCCFVSQIYIVMRTDETNRDNILKTIREAVHI